MKPKLHVSILIDGAENLSSSWSHLISLGCVSAWVPEITAGKPHTAGAYILGGEFTVVLELVEIPWITQFRRLLGNPPRARICAISNNPNMAHQFSNSVWACRPWISTQDPAPLPVSWHCRMEIDLSQFKT